MLKDVIKSARVERGYTQEQIAKLVKVAKQTYLKWENGETEPKATQIQLLAENLGLTANEICSGKRTTKMSLEDFIVETAINKWPSELVTMMTWKMIPDHEVFFDRIEHTSEGQYYEAIGEVGEIERALGKR
ncbi:helix-turn-helix transcriptional regulator [Vibrio tapetis]|uniref:RstR RS2 element transcriptional regulator n=1 Tax=Vibrio tapetis subsp. tapetis TaxID=1671868 RepID=A0A2N8Z9N0_9VIBR|nr:helix-turn-helix transcriptional regulator [Vibrio tapetis]SON48606.1 RstR RS2 element transcriptional regulator [Vibrio tapetis subsp. tapetis]SON53446.1 RstR RS2 element transcriptional regulator [Vibrio tapetis subsp. tapetis]